MCVCVCVRACVRVCTRHVVIVAYSYIGEIGDDAVTGPSKTKFRVLQFEKSYCVYYTT